MRRSQRMSRSGINLLRLILSSYFIGVSLGLVQGTDVTVLAAMVFDGNTAIFAGNTLVFILAYFVLMGMWLRPAALLLAAYVIGSSGHAAFILGGGGDLNAFWRDLALTAGLMMTYFQVSDRDLRHSALMRLDPKPRRIKVTEPVTPRRVVATGKPLTKRPQVMRPDSADVVNIFAT